MTLHRGRDRDISFQCDECEDVLETNTDDFGDARLELKSERWVAVKDEEHEDGWAHYCAQCKAPAPSTFRRWMD